MGSMSDVAADAVNDGVTGVSSGSPDTRSSNLPEVPFICEGA